MGLINLTQRYIDIENLSVIERVMLHLDLDLYSASSIFAIEEEFRNEPPRKKDFFGFKSAMVVVKDCYVKRVYPDYFDEEEPMAALEFGGLLENRPNFYSKDSTTTRVAAWYAGDFADFISDLETFGINRKSFVRVPEIYLKYSHLGDRGDLWIKGIFSGRPVKSKPARDGLLKRLSCLIPEIDIGRAPQPV